MSQIFHYQNQGDDRDALEIGSKFSRFIEFGVLEDNGDFTPDDLTGLDARMHVRSSHDSTVILLEFKKSDGTALVDSLNGRINLLQSAVVTAALIPGCEIYDVELFDPLDDTNVDRKTEGNFQMTNEVTR